MTQAIIYARVASQHSNLDTKIDNLVNYCSNHISKDIQITVNEVLDIAANVSDIMKGANPTQKNKLLSLMLAECYLDGQKLIYKLQKPFDKLVNLKNANTWFDFDKSDIKEYEAMAEKVQMYKI